MRHWELLRAGGARGGRGPATRPAGGRRSNGPHRGASGAPGGWAERQPSAWIGACDGPATACGMQPDGRHQGRAQAARGGPRRRRPLVRHASVITKLPRTGRGEGVGWTKGRGRAARGGVPARGMAWRGGAGRGAAAPAEGWGPGECAWCFQLYATVVPLSAGQSALCLGTCVTPVTAVAKAGICIYSRCNARYPSSCKRAE